MKVEHLSLISQPDSDQVGKVLERMLTSKRGKNPINFYIMSSYVKASGIKRLEAGIRKFRDNGGKVFAIAGIGQHNTSSEGLRELLKNSDEVWVYHNRSDSTFHSKVYAIEDSGKSASLIVGSSNLTAGGLYTNYETSVLCDFDLTDKEQAAAFMRFKKIFYMYKDQAEFCKRLTPSLINQLENKGYLCHDNDQKTEAIKETDTKENEPIFGYLKISPPPLPISSGRKPANSGGEKLGWILVHTKFNNSDELRDQLKRRYASSKEWYWNKVGKGPSKDGKPFIALFECGIDKKIVGDARVHIVRKNKKINGEEYAFYFSLEALSFPKYKVPLSDVLKDLRIKHHRSVINLDSEILANYRRLAYRDSQPPSYLLIK